MGLNCTHGCWDGPYSYFNAFREWVAKQIGIDLNAMVGFQRSYPHTEVIGISWDTVDHPIKPLLNHSDCDGELTVKECDSISKGALMILEDIPVGEYNEFADALYKFANGCKDAIDKNENVEFH